MAEGARLEIVYTARYPGFKSLPLRQLLPKRVDQIGQPAFLLVSYQPTPVIKVQTVQEPSTSAGASGREIWNSAPSAVLRTRMVPP